MGDWEIAPKVAQLTEPKAPLRDTDNIGFGSWNLEFETWNLKPGI
jgi:hypothetical protein